MKCVLSARVAGSFGGATSASVLSAIAASGSARSAGASGRAEVINPRALRATSSTSEMLRVDGGQLA